MPLHTRAQFADLCRLKKDTARAYIASNIKRGKIILTKDGYIDDSNEANRDFLQRCLDKASATVDISIQESNQKLKTPEAAETENVKQDTGSHGAKKERKRNGPSEGGSKYELDLEKKELEIEKLKVDTRLQELKEEKIRGEVIPITLVKQLFSTHSQSIITSQKDGIEYLLISISKEAVLTGDQLAKLRGKMVEILNEATDKAIESTKRNMKSLINEFSIKKEVGEHE
jgi:hypothetical protein